MSVFLCACQSNKWTNFYAIFSELLLTHWLGPRPIKTVDLETNVASLVSVFSSYFSVTFAPMDPSFLELDQHEIQKVIFIFSWCWLYWNFINIKPLMTFSSLRLLTIRQIFKGNFEYFWLICNIGNLCIGRKYLSQLLLSVKLILVWLGTAASADDKI